MSAALRASCTTRFAWRSLTRRRTKPSPAGTTTSSCTAPQMSRRTRPYRTTIAKGEGPTRRGVFHLGASLETFLPELLADLKTGSASSGGNRALALLGALVRGLAHNT